MNSPQTLLSKIYLLLSLIGISWLLFLSYSLEPKLQSIDSMTIKDFNKKVKIQGKIENIKSIENDKTKESFYILTISDKAGKIPVVFNAEPNLNLSLNIKTNQNITIIGRINTYKNNLQIQAEKIIV